MIDEKKTFWETCWLEFWIYLYKFDMPGFIQKSNEDPSYRLFMEDRFQIGEKILNAQQ